MEGVLPAPIAVFFQLNLTLHQLAVLGGPIVNPLAFFAF